MISMNLLEGKSGATNEMGAPASRITLKSSPDALGHRSQPQYLDPWSPLRGRAY
jgi:hypothetical protein